jgi:hypothetical protein
MHSTETKTKTAQGDYCLPHFVQYPSKTPTIYGANKRNLLWLGIRLPFLLVLNLTHTRLCRRNENCKKGYFKKLIPVINKNETVQKKKNHIQKPSSLNYRKM